MKSITQQQQQEACRATNRASTKSSRRRRSAVAVLVTMMMVTSATAFTSQHLQTPLQQQQHQVQHRHVNLQLHATSSNEMLTPEYEQAFQKKNASREKFGLKPMTPIEFMELQTQVAQMDQDMVTKKQEIQVQRQQQQKRQRASPVGNFAKRLFQGTNKAMTEDTCYSNFDCESPKVCCDLGFKKSCCSNGLLQVKHEYAMAEVPVDMRQ